jgi:hypothetical protein
VEGSLRLSLVRKGGLEPPHNREIKHLVEKKRPSGPHIRSSGHLCGHQVSRAGQVSAGRAVTTSNRGNEYLLMWGNHGYKGFLPTGTTLENRPVPFAPMLEEALLALRSQHVYSSVVDCHCRRPDVRHRGLRSSAQRASADRNARCADEPACRPMLRESAALSSCLPHGHLRRRTQVADQAIRRGRVA